MPKQFRPQTLYRIRESQDLMSDGYISDESSNLMFLSIWGRDTPIQQLLARLTLGAAKDGLTSLHIVGPDDSFDELIVPNVQALEKRAAREYDRTLFGTIEHVWLFDRRCIEPDKANGSAVILLPQNDPHRVQRLWSVVRDTCPLPLLPHWCDLVLDLLESRAMLSPLPRAKGPLEGFRLALDVSELSEALGNLIRADRLRIASRESLPDSLHQKVA
jgi:hypothetical protein